MRDREAWLWGKEDWRDIFDEKFTDMKAVSLHEFKEVILDIKWSFETTISSAQNRLILSSDKKGWLKFTGLSILKCAWKSGF